jgi:ABC-type Zn uptake system ZnuABC Zn-binding protein ZnuA
MHPARDKFERMVPQRSKVIWLGIALILTACSSDPGSTTDSATGANDAQSSAQAACDAGTTIASGKRLRISSTVAPITSIVANIAGDHADITGLVPEGTNSHTFEPAPSVAAILAKTDVLFSNGLLLEEPTKDLAAKNLANGAILCELGTAALPVADYIYDFSFPVEGGKPNPHLWTNPPFAKRYAEIVRDVLVRIDPAHAGAYRSNATVFIARINELDTAMVTATATVPANQRKLLTYHDAYAYFAQTYGWTVIGAIQPSNFDEPTAKEIANLITQVRKTGVPAIFGSEVFPSPVLRQIGAETNVKYVDVLRDDDLPGKPGDQSHSFLGLMQFDYVTIVDSLGGDAEALKTIDISDVSLDTAMYPQ